ncbi:hypothetical protein PPE_06005 [Paenibacillus polymyxa E681]|nr:hypothetical protein PPE_06005 [Paenibacillus polymyxa E681]
MKYKILISRKCKLFLKGQPAGWLFFVKSGLLHNGLNAARPKKSLEITHKLQFCNL